MVHEEDLPRQHKEPLKQFYSLTFMALTTDKYTSTLQPTWIPLVNLLALELFFKF